MKNFFKRVFDCIHNKKVEEIRKQEGMSCSLKEQFYIAKVNEARFCLWTNVFKALHAIVCVALFIAGSTGLLFVTATSDELMAIVSVFCGILLLILTAVMNFCLRQPLEETVERFEERYEQYKYEAALLYYELQTQQVEWKREL